MKTSHIEIFFKKLNENRSGPRLIMISNDYERKQMLKQALDTPCNRHKVSIYRHSVSETTLAGVMREMQSPDLLGGTPLVVIDDISKYSKKEVDQFASFLKKDIEAQVIMGTKNKKSLTSLVQLVDKNGLVLDLLAEKIWDKEKRITQFANAKVNNANKKITYPILQHFFHVVGFNMGSVESELEKLIVYVGDRQTIEVDDIQAVSVGLEDQVIWQMADKLIFERDFSINLDEKRFDSDSFYTMLNSFRYQLQIGMKLSSLIKRGESFHNHMRFFPKMFPKALEKKEKVASLLGEDFFKKALELLFKMDLLSKSNVTCYPSLMDLFVYQIKYLKRRKYANKQNYSTSQSSR